MFTGNEVRNSKAQVMEMISAFAYFKRKGLDLAASRYPAYQNFFKENSAKPVEQVEHELMQTLPAKAHK